MASDREIPSLSHCPLLLLSLSLYEKLAELGENAIQSRRTVPYDFRRAPTDVSVKMACISWM